MIYTRYLLLLGFLASLTACPMMGDRISTGRLMDKNAGAISSAGLAHSWATQNGDKLIINGFDATVSEPGCGVQGKITSLTPTAAQNCNSGVVTCGTMNLSITVSNGGDGCPSTGTSQCAFETATGNSQNMLGINCGNSPDSERMFQMVTGS
jgi:hypothetical protein